MGLGLHRATHLFERAERALRHAEQHFHDSRVDSFVLLAMECVSRKRLFVAVVAVRFRRADETGDWMGRQVRNA